MDSLNTRFEREVFNPYRDLLKAEYRFHPQYAHAKQVWEEKLTMEELVNGPYLEKSQMYAQGESLDKLSLHEKTKATISKRLKGHSLYKHQTDALKLILSGQNAVIATGTSSGKTLCYQIPILDDLLRDSSPGLRAIIIYPLNALVNDQLTEWEEMLKAHPQITFARFTGQTPNNQKDYVVREKETISQKLTDERLTQQELGREIERQLEKKLKDDPSNRLNHREAIRDTPPQILITNFSMLEYLMERPVDAPIFDDARLKFLVLDEVHAYRGVQATEIAFLIRRLKDRLRLERLTGIATSATLGNPNDPGSTAKVRKFASDLFDEEFAEPNPIYGTPAKPELALPSFAPTA
ncbi:MAG: DEAD/DEAH box helicase, partial [Acidobacteriota bacterium]|nr:DEAD/DEAH box helicase [Acidobacteriota bacterium]